MFRIMTMNINGYGNRYGLWEIRREIIRQAVQDFRPDVIALQAVRREPGLEQGRDQAAQMAYILPQFHHVFFQEAAAAPDGSADGLAVLSLFPIQEKDCLQLSLQPGLEDKNQRVLTRTRLDLPDGPLELFNAHFSWVAEQAGQNARETMSYLSRFQGPRLLVGDLNQPPDGEVSAQFIQAGWTDAWKSANPEKKGFTFIENDKFVKRIDYAWLSPELSGRLESIRLIANNATMDDKRGSDHAALLIAFH